MCMPTASCLTPRPANCSLPCFTREARHVAGGQFRSAGHNDARLLYHPLLFGHGSTLLDVGSSEGVDLVNFMRKREDNARSLGRAAPVTVHAFEPVGKARQKLANAVATWSGNIHIHDFGLGSSNRTTCFATSGITAHEVTTAQSCSSAASAHVFERVRIVDITAAVQPHHQIELLHVNCEGCEVELLRRLLPDPAARRVAAIELQPHHQIFYKNGMTDDGYCDLEQRLRAAGFRLLYRFPFVWEAWAREKDYWRLRRGLKREHII